MYSAHAAALAGVEFVDRNTMNAGIGAGEEDIDIELNEEEPAFLRGQVASSLAMRGGADGAAGADGGEYSAGTRNGAGASLVGDGLASCALMFGDAADDGRSRSIIFATDNAVNGDSLVSLTDAAQIATDRGITIYGLDANDYDNAFSDEYRTSVEQHGGTYYKLQDDSSVPSIVDAITSEQTSVIRGAPIVLITDRPAGWLIAMLIGMAAWMLIAWRARL